MQFDNIATLLAASWNTMRYKKARFISNQEIMQEPCMSTITHTKAQ